MKASVVALLVGLNSLHRGHPFQESNFLPQDEIQGGKEELSTQRPYKGLRYAVASCVNTD